MKIGFNFDSSIKEAPDGKHQFFIRLSKQFREKGIIIENKKPDIFIRLPGEKINKKAKINILRLDGLIMNTRWEYKSRNKNILRSIKVSDGLIYQGRFCEQAYRKFLGIKNKSFAIIPNGANSTEFSERNVKNFFLANGRWRPHKRLESIINSFLKSLDKGLDSDIIVTGDPDKKVKHPRIKYVGWQKRKELKKLLSGAISSIHLTWLDWCPNSMIEAIVARCPVIYTKSGGHNEIANNSGISISDTYWDWHPIDLYDPPKINHDEVANAMIKLKKEKTEYPINNRLSIDVVSEEYIKYFKEMLK